MASHSPPDIAAFIRSRSRPVQPHPRAHGPSHLGGHDPAGFRLCFVEGHGGEGDWPLPVWAYFAYDWRSIDCVGWSTPSFIDAPPPTFASTPGVKVAFDRDLFELPGRRLANVLSVDDFNRGHLPWLRSRRHKTTGVAQTKVRAGTTLAEFRNVVKLLGGSIYERREDMWP